MNKPAAATREQRTSLKRQITCSKQATSSAPQTKIPNHNLHNLRIASNESHDTKYKPKASNRINSTHQHTNTPTHQHTNTPTHQHTNTPTHQHTNTPIHQHTNTPTHRTRPTHCLHQKHITPTQSYSSRHEPWVDVGQPLGGLPPIDSRGLKVNIKARSDGLAQVRARPPSCKEKLQALREHAHVEGVVLWHRPTAV
jgi:hypothetical protein